MPRLFFICDTTMSMGEFVESIYQSITELESVLQLIDNLDVGICVYTDYGNDRVTNVFEPTKNLPVLFRNFKNVYLANGFDWAEASKTGFAQSIPYFTKDTIVIHYTDAPPHHTDEYAYRPCSGFSSAKSIAAEKQALGKRFDWVTLCKEVRSTGARVFTVTNTNSPSTAPFYACLAEFTNGGCINLGTSIPTAAQITEATMNIIFGTIKNDDPDVEMKMVWYAKNKQRANFNVEKIAQFANKPLWGILPITQHEYSSTHAKNRGVLMPNMREYSTKIERTIDLDIVSLSTRFAMDSRFQETAYDVFGKLLTPTGIMSLTYNPVFGKIWRLICKNRRDPRRNIFMDTISNVIDNLENKSDKLRVQQWIEQSYDSTEEIQEIISECPSNSSYYILETTETMTKSEMMELGRNCNPQILGRIAKFLTNLRCVRSGDSKPVDKFIPSKMSDDDFFSCLPHLMATGVRFSKRPAMLMAIICYRSGISGLADRAHRYLVANRGNWIGLFIETENGPIVDETRPENYSYSLARHVMASQPSKFFTDREVRHFKLICTLGGVKQSLDHELEVETTFTLRDKPITLCFDDKFKCGSCKSWRSKTLAIGKNCAACYLGFEADADRDELKSNMVECRTCRRIYGVLRPFKLNCTPKCHECRADNRLKKSGIKSKKTVRYTLKCGKCCTSYCRASKPGEKNYTCVGCANSPTGIYTSTHTVSVRDFLSGDVHFQGNLEPVASVAELDFLNAVKCGYDIFGNTGFFKNREILYAAIFTGTEPSVLIPTMDWIGRPVQNAIEIKDRICALVSSGTPNTRTCMLCYNDVHFNKCASACGYENCQNLCDDCAKNWFNAAPGCTVLPNSLYCPFCRRAPKYKALRKCNRALCTIRSRNKTNFEPDWYMGWCTACYEIRPAVPKACGDEVPMLNGFECQRCIDDQISKKRAEEVLRLKQEEIRIEKAEELLASAEDDFSKQCPNCSARYVKGSGCDHITCPSCEAHFCDRCLYKGNTAGDVYTHMYSFCELGRGLNITNADEIEFNHYEGIYV